MLIIYEVVSNDFVAVDSPKSNWLIECFHFCFTEKLQRAKEMARPKKDSCPFCKEEKKRPLNAYMRKRSQEKNAAKICEEDDEDDQSKCCSGSHDQAAASK